MNINKFTNINPTKKINLTENSSVKTSKYVQKPDSFERTSGVAFTGKTNRVRGYDGVVKTLEKTSENAQLSLNGQLANDGWAGKTADFVSGLWGSNNRAHLVQADIEEYNKQVDELNASIKENKFEAKFEEIFGVKYNRTKVQKSKEKTEEFKEAVTSKCLADITKSKLKSDIELYKKNSGKLQGVREMKPVVLAGAGMVPYYEDVKTKDDVLSDMENSLIEVVGSKEILSKIIELNVPDKKNLNDDDKYEVYGKIANYLVDLTGKIAEKSCKGKSLADIKSGYEKAYKEAYGEKNNIQERVDKYNRSQEIGAATVKGVVRAGLLAGVMTVMPASGLGKVLASSVSTMGVKIGVEISDKAVNDIDNTVDLGEKAIKKIVRSSAISGLDSLLSGVAGMVVPSVKTASEIANTVLEQGKGVLLDTAIGMTTERMKQGKWYTNQIVPRMVISATFRNLGADSQLTKQLLKMTKSGLNQAMKKSTRDYDVMAQFVQGTKMVLDKGCIDGIAEFAELKEFAEKYPDEYNDIIVDLLQKESEELMNSNEE